MQETSWNEITVCPVCKALVPRWLWVEHGDWHDAIAAVAIETTARLDSLYLGCTKTSTS